MKETTKNGPPTRGQLVWLRRDASRSGHTFVEPSSRLEASLMISHRIHRRGWGRS